ncbi:MAG: glycosyltransferase family 39 protein [Chloroflexota bacterium]
MNSASVRRSLLKQANVIYPILLLAAVLRFYAIDASSLWSDEGNTWALLSRSFDQIARNAAADIHPPGYYWLLKIWTSVFGRDVIGMRSFSAIIGTLLVAVVYQIAIALRKESGPGWTDYRLPLLTAFIAALNPFQIYYSQEARMYILLALETGLLLWAWLVLMQSSPSRRQITTSSVGFCLAGIAGLWTHYSFPIVLAATSAAWLWHILINRQTNHSITIRYYIAINIIIILAFLPWLPTAIERVLNWPQGGEVVHLIAGGQRTLETLLVGPLDMPQPNWLWLVGGVILPITGIIAIRRYSSTHLIIIAFFAPIALIFGLGLFSDAFMKFLLMASPLWVLLVAGAPQILPTPFRPLGTVAILFFVVGLVYQTMPSYYTNPFVRDNYAGVSAYVNAVGTVETSLVILNAPGQQEVWSYYNPSTDAQSPRNSTEQLPVLALPQTRPPDADTTQALLADAVRTKQDVFALFWATDESDPERVVERWLDANAFKGLDSWQGNLRFVTYSLPNTLTCHGQAQMPIFGDMTALQDFCTSSQTIQAGQVALFQLKWLPLQTIPERFKVTIQILNTANQVVAQRDSEPRGGSLPTTDWQPNRVVIDNHGVMIPPGTPPGDYRVILALYHVETSERLAVGAGNDALALTTLTIQRADETVSSDVLQSIIPMHHRINRLLGPVTLVGYDVHKRGYAHDPTVPLRAGDWVHFNLYWQAPDMLPDDWPTDSQFTLTLGGQAVRMPLAGWQYPTAQWYDGEFVRGSVDVLFDGQGVVPEIVVGGESVRLRRVIVE